MRLAELKPGLALTGLEPNLVCTLIAVLPYAANAVQVIYRLPDGGVKERLLVTADEPSIELATVERPWAFDGDAAAFQLACEAKRIDLAFLFDPMMAVHTSNVDPLPHQVSASLAKSRLNTIAEEVIAILAGHPMATIRVTLEIDAEYPNGAGETIRRAVSENATSLGFKVKDWE